ncbi:3-deoxy-7-phosphoheptulonate synthase [Hathewaya histolytica]|uniref:3-deoxy-7-phosphoheptulonate synthase n=1 Tax=Hathewaya histolytica TaxID=1498 RepID=A0A4U9RAP4_HATHI|nr:3-deoxy-7-phosphoheptulonate synthase [Hathewaya histolytica]VTQ87978.1 3-deoxy-7-phosphoheptulonate synthase [Hathewaya histolytica]
MEQLKTHKSQGENLKIKVGDFYIGGKEKVIISGPCAVESYEQMDKIASKLKNMGVHMLRGGAFKPRTSPYDFQGLEEDGIKILYEIGQKYNLPVVTEILDSRDLEKYLDYIDIIQIGSRNMYNYALLKEVGKCNKPIMLKRGISATIKEWLFASEYILKEGNKNVILCERGIRTFEQVTRNTLDLNAIAYIKNNYRLPIIIDPSHGTGLREIVKPMALAGIMAGADGIIVESHFEPEKSISDARQTISLDMIDSIVKKIKHIEESGILY